GGDLDHAEQAGGEHRDRGEHALPARDEPPPAGPPRLVELVVIVEPATAAPAAAAARARGPAGAFRAAGAARRRGRVRAPPPRRGPPPGAVPHELRGVVVRVRGRAGPAARATPHHLRALLVRRRPGRGAPAGRAALHHLGRLVRRRGGRRGPPSRRGARRPSLRRPLGGAAAGRGRPHRTGVGHRGHRLGVLVRRLGPPLPLPPGRTVGSRDRTAPAWTCLPGRRAGGARGHRPLATVRLARGSLGRATAPPRRCRRTGPPLDVAGAPARLGAVAVVTHGSSFGPWRSAVTTSLGRARAYPDKPGPV